MRGRRDCLGTVPAWAAGSGSCTQAMVVERRGSWERLFWYLLPQVHWEEIHFQHGDRGGVTAVWVCPGFRIRDVCKKPEIRMVVWYQWDHPCLGRGGLYRKVLPVSLFSNLIIPSPLPHDKREHELLALSLCFEGGDPSAPVHSAYA